MKRLLSIVALLGMSFFAINMVAQQTPSSTPSSSSQSNSASQQSPSTPSTSSDSSSTSSQTSAATPSESARSFEGKITKSGDQYVLQDNTTSTSYKLDDQDKAKQYEGQNVKVMATMDSSNNTLHVVDITPSSK
jgi:cytoskeletal protein RodZ